MSIGKAGKTDGILTGKKRLNFPDSNLLF